MFTSQRRAATELPVQGQDPVGLLHSRGDIRRIVQAPDSEAPGDLLRLHSDRTLQVATFDHAAGRKRIQRLVYHCELRIAQPKLIVRLRTGSSASNGDSVPSHRQHGGHRFRPFRLVVRVSPEQLPVPLVVGRLGLVSATRCRTSETQIYQRGSAQVIEVSTFY